MQTCMQEDRKNRSSIANCSVRNNLGAAYGLTVPTCIRCSADISVLMAQKICLKSNVHAQTSPMVGAPSSPRIVD